jgi:hypothetical protein
MNGASTRLARCVAALALGTTCALGYATRAEDAPAMTTPGAVALLTSSTIASSSNTELASEAVEDAFFDEPDAPIRQALASERIVAVEKGRGGRSLAFRLTLTSGQKGYFKPEQSFSAANWFGEVAAYHLDRMLGLHRVPAVVSRVLPWNVLAPVAGADPRKSEVTVRNGKVVGAFVAWVGGGLRPMEQQEGWERWLRLGPWHTTTVSPFQRPVRWQQDAARARQFGAAWRSREVRARLRKARPVPASPDRPGELSDLIVFDYLTRNLDRWGGRNANVLIRGAAGPLVFLDNGAGFEPGRWHPALCDARLSVLQRFRRRTIGAIRALDVERYEARLAGEGVTPVLGRSQLLGLAARRESLLERIVVLEARYGQAIWFSQ